MTETESDPDERITQEYIPEGVLKGIEDIVEGRTLSDEDLDDILKF